MNASQWIFISPHLDDVALSCGGLVWSLTQEGQQVSIWTMLAGDPPDENYSDFARQTHQIWGKAGAEAIAMRRAEDRAACARLGAEPRHFDLLDAIYRRVSPDGAWTVNNNTELFGDPPEPEMVARVADLLARELPEDAQLVLPLSLGSHIDHRLVAEATHHTLAQPYFIATIPIS